MLGLRRRFGLVLGLAASSLLVFCAAQVVNYYREPWLGIVPGVAGHNFSFNLVFYIPATIISSCLALISAILYLRSLRTLRRTDACPSLWERATILPVVPILIFDGLFALFMIRVVMSSPA